MKTQDFVKEVSDRNSPIKKLAEKMISNIDNENYLRNDATVATRLGVTIDWSKVMMTLVQAFFVEIRKKRVFFRRFSPHFISSID